MVACKCTGFAHGRCINKLRLQAFGVARKSTLRKCTRCGFRYHLHDSGFCPVSSKIVQVLYTVIELGAWYLFALNAFLMLGKTFPDRNRKSIASLISTSVTWRQRWQFHLRINATRGLYLTCSAVRLSFSSGSIERGHIFVLYSFGLHTACKQVVFCFIIPTVAGLGHVTYDVIHEKI